MRCMITANRRASATMAFFIPRCLAIFIAQALSHDHFVERNQHDLRRFKQHSTQQGIATFRDAAHAVALARLMPRRRQSKHRANRLRVSETAGRVSSWMRASNYRRDHLRRLCNERLRRRDGGHFLVLLADRARTISGNAYQFQVSPTKQIANYHRRAESRRFRFRPDAMRWSSLATDMIFQFKAT